MVIEIKCGSCVNLESRPGSYLVEIIGKFIHVITPLVWRPNILLTNCLFGVCNSVYGSFYNTVNQHPYFSNFFFSNFFFFFKKQFKDWL